MPELPEVQTVVNTLHDNVVGQRIDEINLIYPKLVESGSLALDSIIGQTIHDITRRGKYIVFHLDNCFLVSHLRMEGRYYISSDKLPFNKHSHCLFHLSNGQTIQYLDTRKFGRLSVTDDIDTYFLRKGLGLEPFDSQVSGTWLYEHLQKYNKAIKACLLDQSIITGLGNIYADEVLFKTKIHPETSPKMITKKQCQLLIDSIQSTLKDAIAQGGTTFRSFESSQHVTGLFQINLVAYGKAGIPCPRCQTVMERIVVAGRGSTYCPHCQKKKVFK